MKVSLKEGLAILISIAAYLFAGYFLERSQFYLLLLCFLMLFAAYGMVLLPALRKEIAVKDVDKWLVIGMLFRLLFLFSVPVLSDDYFRFIWDGAMTVNGMNPYLVMPDNFMQQPVAKAFPLSGVLYENMNSGAYYTIYPPICQGVFMLAAGLFPKDLHGSIVVMRVLIILAEAGTLILVRRLVSDMRIRPAATLIYALNPLVVIELSGNLHPEAFMIFFMMLAFYFLWAGKRMPAAIFWGVSIASKLIPLMFLPVLIRRLGWKKAVAFAGIAIMTFALLFSPYLSTDFLDRFFSSINLYFRSFEFNASVYYLVRWAGMVMAGHNIIAQAGPILSMITFVAVLLILMLNKNKAWPVLFRSLLWSLTVYFLLATTVHPWYLTTLVLLAVFVEKSNFVLVWSGMVVLSYAAYRYESYHEDLWLTALEYMIVCTWFVREYFISNNSKGSTIVRND